MTLLRTGLAAGSLLLLGVAATSAADLGGSRNSMKDSEPAEQHRACSGERFGGFYAGVNFGLANQNSKWEETFADFSPDYQDSPLKTTRSGFTGGGTLGYNRVRCNFLLGIESDLNFANTNGSTDHYPNQPALAGAGFARITDGMRGFATLRGRMGIVADRTLFYATGGLAWANLRHKMEDIGHFDGGLQNPEQNGWKAGWALGGGFEHALTERVSLKGEALYMDFGKQSYSFTDHAPPPGDFYAFEHRANVVTARVGLNIKLGDVPPRNGCGRDDCDARPLK